MLHPKRVHPIVPIERTFTPNPKDPYVLVCTQCPLPKCKNPTYCKRYKEEVLKIRSGNYEKGRKKEN